MKTFLVYENDIIINAIVAETQEKAEEAVGPNIIETILYGKPWIGWTKYQDNTWRPEKPHESWDEWDNSTLEWMPPIPKPDTPSLWNEEIEDWIIIAQPYPSWIIQGNEWVAPKPRPNDGLAYDWDEDKQEWVLSQQ